MLVLVSENMCSPENLRGLFEKLKNTKRDDLDISVAIKKTRDEKIKDCINEEKDKDIRIFFVDTPYSMRQLSEKQGSMQWKTVFGGARFELIIHYVEEVKEKPILV